MTAWVQGRTSWLSKPPMQSKRSAASGCTSAAVQWVYRIKQLAEVSVEIQITRLGSSYLSINAFFFFFLIVCPDRSRLSPSARCCRLLLTALWRQTSPEAGEMDGSWDSEVGEPWLRCDCLKKCNPFLFFFFFFNHTIPVCFPSHRVASVTLSLWCLPSPVKSEPLWICLNHFLRTCFQYLTCSCVTCHMKSTAQKQSVEKEMVAFKKKKKKAMSCKSYLM